MISRVPSLLALSSLVLLPCSAMAAPAVYTPAIAYHAGIDDYRCIATNTGTKAVEAVTVEIVRVDFGFPGAVLATNTMPAEPGQATFAILGDLSGGPTAVCRVTGLKSKTATVTFQAIDASDVPLVTVTKP